MRERRLNREPHRRSRPLGRLTDRALVPLRGEQGVALPVAMLVLAAMLALVGVVASQATVTSENANEDRDHKRALQAADAGLEAAMSRLNRQPSTIPALPCFRPGIGFEGYDLGLSGWCRPVTEDLGDGTSYSYRISQPILPPIGGPAVKTVVSTGTAEGVVRRVAVGAANPRVSAFEDFGVRSHEELHLDSNSLIGTPENPTKAASNAAISLDSNAQICGDVTPGYPDYPLTLGGNSSLCPGYSTSPATEPFRLAEVTPPTTDDNTRIKVLDTCTQCGSVSWSPLTRRLELNGNSTLTLGGTSGAIVSPLTYRLCHLRLDSNSTLMIRGGVQVRIYILPPEQCTGSPEGGIELNSNSRIVNTSPNTPSNLQIFVVGSATQETAVNINSNFNNDISLPVLIYAPNSVVHLDSNVQILGAVAGKRVELDSNSQILYHGAAAAVTVIDSFLKGFDYRECRATSSSATNPGEGC